MFPAEGLAGTSRRLAAVEAFLDLLTRDYKFGDFVREILRATMKAVPSEAGSILELDWKNESLFFRAVEGQSADRVNSFVIPFGQGIVGHVAESRQPMVVNDMAENRVHLKSIQDAVGFPTRNLVAVPIVIRGKVFGVLELLNRVGESDYSPDDIELLQALCEHAGKAIEVRLMLAWALRSAA